MSTDSSTLTGGREAPGRGIAIFGRVRASSSTTELRTGLRAPEVRSSVALGLSFAGAVGFVVLAGARSEAGGYLGSSINLFWLGMLLFSTFALAILLKPELSPTVSYLAVSLAALLVTVPKVALSVGGPVYGDEILHWRQTLDLISSGKIGQQNVVLPVLADYPGLHGLTATLAGFSGLSAWTVAIVVVVVSKLLLLAGVLALTRAITSSLRAGALAALLYAMSPNIMFFDSQFAYESLALVFFVWALAFLARAHRSQGSRFAMNGLAMICAVACLITHHLTSVALLSVVSVAVLSIGVQTARGRERGTGDRALSAWLAVFTVILGLWWLPRLDRIGVYLSNIVGGGAAGLARLAQRVTGSDTSGGAARELFAQSAAPSWTRALAFLTPLAVVIVAGIALRTVRGQRLGPLQRAAAALALTYLVAMVLILTPGGDEIGHRALGFAWIGIAVIVGSWLHIVTRHGRSKAVALATVALGGAVFVGNVTAGALPEAMLPGPQVFGVDSRSGGSEATALSSWVRRVEGKGGKVIADRYVSLELSRGALAAPAPARTSFWELFFRSGRPEPYVLSELADRGYNLIAIDERMYRLRPLTGNYLAPAEPANVFTSQGASPAAQRKFDAPWASRVYASPTYSMFRFDRRALDTCTRVRAPLGFGRGCSAGTVR